MRAVRGQEAVHRIGDGCLSLPPDGGFPALLWYAVEEPPVAAPSGC
jgi:hypothetical protein